MEEKQIGYAERIFGGIEPMQRELRKLIKSGIRRKKMTYAELDELCSFDRILPRKQFLLPRTVDFMADPSEITELVFILACIALGVTIGESKVMINEETYQYALNEINGRDRIQGPPPRMTDTEYVRLYVLMRALSEIA